MSDPLDKQNNIEKKISDNVEDNKLHKEELSTPTIDGTFENDITNTRKEDKKMEHTSPPDANVTDEAANQKSNEKDVLEINLDQTNISELADSQENNANIFLNKSYAAALNIHIRNNNLVEEQKLNFYEFRNMNYRERLSVGSLSYINFFIKKLLDKFNSTRVVVINNSLILDEIAMATIEALIFTNITPAKTHLYSCTIDKQNITLDYIVNQFKKHNLKTWKSRIANPSFIIIYGNKDFPANNTELLRPVFSKGGIADSITNSLKTDNLFIIYLCNNTSLYRKNVQERAYFSLLNISDIHLYLYEKISDGNAFLRIIRLVEIALSEYNWLSKRTLEEQKEKLSDLIKDGTLEAKLKDQIESIDLEERKIITDLALDQLYSIVLFTAAFFEGISVGEFDNMIKFLITGQRKAINNEARIPKVDDLAISWATGGDDVLANCGITRQFVSIGFSTYRFESISRKRNTSRIFCDKYSLNLLWRFEIIENSFLLTEQSLSESFLDGLTELAFVNAQTDQERYLATVCLNITEQLGISDRTEKQLKDLFTKLIFFIKKWSDNDLVSQYLGQFYHRMMETPFRRNIMGAILTHVCVPSRPDNLRYLKVLLDGTGEDEYFVKFSLTPIIVYNYLDKISYLLSEINGWADNSNPNRASQSFSFAKTSLFLVFYEKRFSWTNETGLDYQIIKKLANDISGNQFMDLVSFVFAKNSTKAFNEVFGKVISKQLHDGNLLVKAQTDSLFSMYAFMLIRWYYLLTIIKAEKDTSTIDVDKMMKDSLLSVKEEFEWSSLLSALQKAIKKYNVLIIKGNEITDKKHEKKAAFKTKRDAARFLIELIEQIR